MYRIRTGCPWRELPTEFGNWSAVFRRFNLWSRKGVLQVLFKTISQETDVEWLFVDGCVVRAHQQRTGARGVEAEAIGRSRGGNSTKIHLAVDSYGLPVHFELSGGQAHEAAYGEKLVSGAPVAAYTIGDNGYDSESLRERIRARGSVPVIPHRKTNTLDNHDMGY